MERLTIRAHLQRAGVKPASTFGCIFCIYRILCNPFRYKSNEDYVYVRGRGRGKYICEECGIRCKKPSMLKKHIRTHTDVRPYICRVCNFAFKTKGEVAMRHRRTPNTASPSKYNRKWQRIISHLSGDTFVFLFYLFYSVWHQCSCALLQETTFNTHLIHRPQKEMI